MHAEVMVVDDEEGFRTMVSDALSDDGVKVIQAGSGEECIQNLRNGFRGVILLDINMTGMDGWATIEAMVDQNLTDGSSICMFTSVVSPPERAGHLEPYVSGYIIKNGDLDTIAAKVREYLILLGLKTDSGH